MSPHPGSEWAAALALIGLSLAVLPSMPREKSWSRTLVLAVGLVVTVRYLYWRLVQTVLPADPWTGAGLWIWTVFLFELAALANCSITYLMLTRTSDHTAEADAHEHRLRRSPAWKLPRVDVFLCTYNEGIEVLEGPIVAAKHMDYPNFKVWVLDDGRRDWLRAFCAAQGVGYLDPPRQQARQGRQHQSRPLQDGRRAVRGSRRRLRPGRTS